MVELIEVLIQAVTASILTLILIWSAPHWRRGGIAAAAALAIPLSGMYFAFAGFETRYEIRKCTIGFCGEILLKTSGLAVGVFSIGFVISMLISMLISEYLSRRRRAAATRDFE